MPCYGLWQQKLSLVINTIKIIFLLSCFYQKQYKHWTSYNIIILQRQVDDHIDKEHPTKFRCEFCQEIFQSASKLRSHKSHKKMCRTKRYSSSENSNSSDSSSAKSHLCSNCGAAFTRRQNLNKHIKYNCNPLG